MENPVLVDVTRGGYVESRHRGMVYVMNDAGEELLSIGDVDRLVYPRSSIKIMQALPVVESGAADHYKLTDAELSLICASHNGEVGHTETALSILSKIGKSCDDLECGGHMPYHKPSEYALVKADEDPSALHNNCSGKHSGILTYAAFVDIDHQGYIDPEHDLQKNIEAIMSELTEYELEMAPCGTDGCSLPTWAAPLKSWALAFAKISRQIGMDEKRANAFDRLQKAVMAEPFYVAGTDRYCTNIMQKLSTPLFVKTGAEGVFCASLPEHGIGIALKCEDGLTRGSEMMLSATLKKLGVLPAEDLAKLDEFLSITLKNCNKMEVAEIKPSDFWQF